MRITILAVALAVALLVAGCGGSSSDSAKTNTIQSTPTQTTPTTTTTAPTTSTPTGGGVDTTPTTPPDTSTGTGGTPSGGTNGSGGVYPGQQPSNPNQSPGERYRQYCAAHPSACGD
jgi:hypothetical protein